MIHNYNSFRLVSMGVAMSLQSNISNIFNISTAYFPLFRNIPSRLCHTSNLRNNASIQDLSSQILQLDSSFSLWSVSHFQSEIDHPHIVIVYFFIIHYLHINIRINFTLGKAHACQEAIYSAIPSSGSLFQSIQCLLQFAYMILSIFNLKSLWIFYVYFLFNHTI